MAKINQMAHIFLSGTKSTLKTWFEKTTLNILTEQQKFYCLLSVSLGGCNNWEWFEIINISLNLEEEGVLIY